MVVDLKKLTAVTMKASGQVVRRYDFVTAITSEYLEDPSKSYRAAGEHTLSSVTLIGSDGTSAMPATTFTYESRQQYFKDSSQGGSNNDNPGNPYQFNRPYLTTVSNGYGATVTYTYAASPPTAVDDVWRRQVVTQMSADPDPGTETQGVPVVTTFEYTGNSSQPTYPEFLLPGGDKWKAEHRGFRQTKVVAADNTYEMHRFYTTGTFSGLAHPVLGTITRDADKLKGKEYETESFTAAGVRLLKTFSDWDWSWVNESLGVYSVRLNNSGQVTYLDGTTERTKAGPTISMTRTGT
jgi:hypothetical protein